jgi:ArsR family transcriptional regulator
MTDLFDVLADETRRAIVTRLNVPSPDSSGGMAELSVGELVEAVGATQPTVSKHLKVLREADIVRVREDGQHRYYRLNPGGLSSVATWVGGVVGGVGSDVSAMELQEPYVDLWSVGYRVGSLVADVRDAVVGLMGRPLPSTPGT